MAKKDSHFIPAPFKTTTEYENKFIKDFNKNLAGAVAEVLKYMAKVTASAIKDGIILKSEGDNDIEKAHSVGDIHPNGLWAWTQLPSGKFDWRTAVKVAKQPNLWDIPADIEKCTTSKQCVDYLVKNKMLRSNSDLGKCGLPSAKRICAVVYNIQKKHNPTPIEIKFRKLSGGVAMLAADGRKIEINSDYYTNFDEARAYKRNSLDYNQRLKDGVNSIDRNIKKLLEINPNHDIATLLEKKKDLEKKIKSCPQFTVEHPDSVTQDTMIHEFGHILNSQCSGGCGHRFVGVRSKEYLANADKLNKERNKVFKEYLDGGVYISEYSKSKPAEFFAESFVVYSHGDKNLPDNVKKFMDNYFKTTKPQL